MKQIIVLLCSLLLAASLYAQTDSIGVYSVLNSNTQRIEAIKYSQIKIAGTKTNLVFSGSTSPNHFKGSATFRLYFGVPSPIEVSKYAFFTSSYSIKDFGVGRFSVKKGNRQITTAKISIFGATIGGNTADGLAIQTKQISDHCYEIVVSGEAGEYCIMPIIGGTGGYTGVFDFSIE